MRVAVAVALLAAAVPAAGQEVRQRLASAPLFPEPFVVEHRIAHQGPDGSRWEGEPVRDYYGGSLLVSVRADGSRTVVDFARREIIEVRPAHGSYSVLSFDRLAALRDRLASRPERITSAPLQQAPGADDTRPAPDYVVQEMADSPPDLSPARGGGGAGAVRHLRVSEPAEDGQAREGAFGKQVTVDVWVDQSRCLSPAAVDALSTFESEVLGGERSPAAALVAAARRHAGGAFPVRTVKPVSLAGGAPSGTAEDLVTSMEPLATLAPEIVSVPYGYRRVAHPLEAMAAFLAEEEAYGKPQARRGR